jgi:protein-tyrosine phosphatase
MADSQSKTAPDGPSAPPFVDIHCHMLPGIDDGAANWRESLAMGRMAAADGFQTVIVTPHQLGNFSQNTGDDIRQRVHELQRFFDRHEVALTILPGGDVRIEPDMVARLRAGEVVSLADLRRHVLLELPHELYLPLEGVLDELLDAGMIGILSHPERNHGLLEKPRIVEKLVDRGCLMQVTAGSLLGTFGPKSQDFSEWMLSLGLVHFLATDAHSSTNRRPLLGRAFERAAKLANWSTAVALCFDHPRAVAEGRDVDAGRMPIATNGRRRKKAA